MYSLMQWVILPHKIIICIISNDKSHNLHNKVWTERLKIFNLSQCNVMSWPTPLLQNDPSHHLKGDSLSF